MSAQYKKQHMQKKLVFGLGQTGLSCVRFLVREGYDVAVFDTRPNPPLVETINNEFPHVEVTLQNVTESMFDNVDQIILSPGLSLESDELKIANERKIEIVGDIELFALSLNDPEKSSNAPVIAITGSNGKTTTTTLISEIFKAAGLNVETGGNIGTPVLELLNKPTPDYYILELSSFQLETTRHLRPAVAVVLNISADHMDRYADLNDYANTKFSVFENAARKVINLDDQWLSAKLDEKSKGKKEYTEASAIDNSIASSVENSAGSTDKFVGFTENKPRESDYGLLKSDEDSTVWIAKGAEKYCDSAALKLQGRHQLMNAIAAVAVADACHIDKTVICKVLSEFDGLEHRTQFVESIDGVNYINDSKGTNVGATLAAIKGFDTSIILLAGGDGKGADFSELAEVVKNKVRYAILFGRDAGLIEKAISNATSVIRAVSLEAAVVQAHELARSGETVLLSPACASFDMFDNYQHRGDVFMQAVRGLKNNVS